MHPDFDSFAARERLAERRRGLRGALVAEPSRPFCSFRDGRLWRGLQSSHRTREARRWRTLLRLKLRTRFGSAWFVPVMEDRPDIEVPPHVWEDMPAEGWCPGCNPDNCMGCATPPDRP